MQGKEFFQNRKIADKLSLVIKVIFVVLAVNNILFATLLVAFGHPVFLIIPVLGLIAIPVLGQLMIKALADNILEPLEQLENAAEAISNGNLDIEVSYDSQDELGSLAQSFRKTSSTLKRLSMILISFLQSSQREIWMQDQVMLIFIAVILTRC